MGFNSAFKIVKNPGNGRLNNLNDPDRPQCVKLLCDLLYYFVLINLLRTFNVSHFYIYQFKNL